MPESDIDLAVIELGTNDIKKTNLRTFRETYDRVLNRIQGSPQAKIICVGTWGFDGSTGSDPYDAAIESSCKAHGGVYVDLSRLFEDKTNIGPEGRDTWAGPADDFHPNDQGHGLIADALLDHLRAKR